MVQIWFNRFYKVIRIFWLDKNESLLGCRRLSLARGFLPLIKSTLLLISFIYLLHISTFWGGWTPKDYEIKGKVIYPKSCKEKRGGGKVWVPRPLNIMCTLSFCRELCNGLYLDHYWVLFLLHLGLELVELLRHHGLFLSGYLLQYK